MKNNKNIIPIIFIIIVALVIMVIKLPNKNNKNNTIKTKNGTVKIVANQELTLEEYKNDVFKMEKPKGWVVETGGAGIYYAIKAYDQKNPNNQIFLMLKMEPLLKSTQSKQTWQNYYNMSGNNSQYRLFSEAVVLDSPTTEQFYKKFKEISAYCNSIEPTLATFKFPTLNNFTKQDESESQASMKSVALDSKVLRATFTGENNKAGEGLFLASIVNFGNSNAGFDTSYYMVYDIMAITTEKDKFIDYKDTLLKTINSIDFSEEYVKQTIDNNNAQTKRTLEINAQMQKAFDSYMSAWENRNKTYDIMSQKQSDAILGYERVYDTETNDIYKTYNGFTDDYQGDRYKTITDDMYTEKTSGYIEKIN